MNWDRETRQTDRDVRAFWLLQATSCSSDPLCATMKNRDGSEVSSQGHWCSLRCLQTAQGERWGLRFENVIMVRCVFQAWQSLKNEMFNIKSSPKWPIFQHSYCNCRKWVSPGIYWNCYYFIVLLFLNCCRSPYKASHTYINIQIHRNIETPQHNHTHSSRSNKL